MLSSIGPGSYWAGTKKNNNRMTITQQCSQYSKQWGEKNEYLYLSSDREANAPIKGQFCSHSQLCPRVRVPNTDHTITLLPLTLQTTIDICTQQRHSGSLPGMIHVESHVHAYTLYMSLYLHYCLIWLGFVKAWEQD